MNSLKQKNNVQIRKTPKANKKKKSDFLNSIETLHSFIFC